MMENLIHDAKDGNVMENYNDRLVTVEGVGVCDVPPDSVRFECSLDGRCQDHAEAVRRSSECAVPLRDAIVRAGFPADILKTVSVSVRPYYENVHEGDVYHTEFAGFEYDHRLRIDTDSDNGTIGRVMDAMVSADVQYNMTYRLRDSAAAEAEARCRAVKDARVKAEQLASAGGVRLGKMMRIVYASQEEAAPYRTMSIRANAPDIVPENIRVSDTVTVSWSML